MTRLLRLALYREDLAYTPAAVVSIETNRVTRRWRAWVRPDGSRAFRPVTPQQLAAVPLCDSPAEVRAVLLGGAS